jgi:hypothetical protein
MPVNKKTARVREQRMDNYRPSEKARALLKEIQIARKAQGKYHSLNQLFVEAIFFFHAHELGDKTNPGVRNGALAPPW